MSRENQRTEINTDYLIRIKDYMRIHTIPIILVDTMEGKR